MFQPILSKTTKICIKLDAKVSFLSTCSQELRGIKDDDLPSHTLKLTVVFKHKCDAKQGIFDSSTATIHSEVKEVHKGSL